VKGLPHALPGPGPGMLRRIRSPHAGIASGWNGTRRKLELTNRDCASHCDDGDPNGRSATNRGVASGRRLRQLAMGQKRAAEARPPRPRQQAFARARITGSETRTGQCPTTSSLQIRVIEARQAIAPLGSIVMSILAFSIESTCQPSAKLALISSLLTRLGPQSPGWRSLKQSMW
jgi:hypothetical protein